MLSLAGLQGLNLVLFPVWYSSKVIYNMHNILAILTLILLNSCVSSFIAGDGKKYGHLETAETQREQVIKELGSPIYSISYSAPTKVKFTSEYHKHKNQFKDHPKVVNIALDILSNGDPNKDVKFCDVYSCRGVFHFPGINMHYEMTSAMTPGIADILFIPAAFSDRISKLKRRDYLTIWFDSNMRYVATARGNLESQSQMATENKPSD